MHGLAARECSEAASLIGMAEFHYDYYVYPLHDGNWAPPPRSQWLYLPPKQVQRVEKNDKQVFLADLMAGMGVYLPYAKVSADPRVGTYERQKDGTAVHIERQTSHLMASGLQWSCMACPHGMFSACSWHVVSVAWFAMLAWQGHDPEPRLCAGTSLRVGAAAVREDCGRLPL